MEDQQLFGWFMRREQPQDPQMQRIVSLIYESRQKSS